MRFLSMFSGIDAASVAWNHLGWKAAAFCEIEPFPSAVLAHHYPNVPNLGDVTKADFDAIGPVDLVVFGSPCQSFSIAGKRLGLDDPRGNLALLGGRVVYHKRPRWFVFENVPGLLSSDGGLDFGTLIAAFAGYPPGSVFAAPEGGWRNSGVVEQAGPNGYGLAWRVLDAQYVRVDGYEWAVPQRRRRVFVVGYLGDWRRAAAVLFERESLRWDSPPRRKAGKGFAGDVAPSLVSSGRGVERAGDTRGQDPIVAMCLNAHPNGSDAETETLLPVAHSLRGGGFDASEDGTGRGTPLAPIFARESGPGFWMQDDVAGTLRAEGEDRPSRPSHVLAFDTYNQSLSDISPSLRNPNGTFGDGLPAVAFQSRASADNSMNPSDVAPPLDVGKAGGVSVGQRGMMVRRLTPMECERLQGFPDRYTAVPYRGKLAADGPRYKALGNSFAVNVVRWIGMRIQIVEEMTNK